MVGLGRTLLTEELLHCRSGSCYTLSSRMLLFDVTHQALEAGLRGSSMRSQALAQNLANINTPGYRRVDVDFRTQLSEALQRAQNVGGPVAPAFQVGTDPNAAPVRADGNTVDVDQENATVAENALQYQGLTQLLGLRKRELELIMRTSGV